MKIGILDEGYWSPELFRGYQAMASMSERGFKGPGKRWGALWAKGKGQTIPLRAGSRHLTAHETLWGGWAHMVDPQNPFVTPGTLLVIPKIFPKTK